MRGLLYAFLWLIAAKHQLMTKADDEFYPTPIPLNEWHPAERSAPEEPPSLKPDSPAPYWEDALRHSVYLTMVRDKIDQLIARDVSHQTNEEVDDHDLWNKIKNAPFDRIEIEEPAEDLGDITIMAKGRLMEDKEGYRFKEDPNVKPCSNESCMEGATALWSVRRVRQRDSDTTGRYHHELTFSVITGAPKRVRKPHENPARTFTVRETAPETIVDAPHEYRPAKEIPQHQMIRPGRALWVHKNIVPTQKHQPRYYRLHDTDRLFTSLFMDDDYEAHRRPPAPHPPHVYTQYSKVGYVGSPSPHYHYKKFTPYSYKQQQTPIKYSKPPVYTQIPPHVHYLDIDAIGVVSDPYASDNVHPTQSKTRIYVPNKVVKTTKPPVLPTPVHTPPPTQNTTLSPTVSSFVKDVNASFSSRPVETVTVYNKLKGPVKISYFNDNLRPPVYNAPPGVFVTMDKKPFKPLPPMKLHSLKTIRPSKPLDFRPSPQLLDIQFSEPDPLFDGAFRPITVNYAQRNETDASEYKTAESSKTEEKLVTKVNVTDSKIPKKTKKSRVTTTTTTTTSPIITSQSAESDFDLSWGNLLGAFTKTTPMSSHSEQFSLFDNEPINITSTTSEPTTTTTSTTTEAYKEPTTTTVASTTAKRTRPPPLFKNEKTNKIKKHKRVTTKSPLQVAPLPSEKKTKINNDLTPQASSAATSGTRTTGRWTPSSTSTTSTTSKPLTTLSAITQPNTYHHTKATTTTTTQEPQNITESSKKYNRYRQSTLMQKGTSVKHDKWSITNNNIISSTVPTRRIESNFHGYTITSTSPYSAEIVDEDDYDDYDLTTTTEQQKMKSNPNTSTSEYTEYNNSGYTQNIEEPVVHTVSEALHYKRKNEENEAEDYNYDETGEQTNYFTSTIPMPSKSNEEVEDIQKKEVTSDNSIVKPKKKCKKKQANSTLVSSVSEEVTSPTSPQPSSTQADIFEELFGSFTSEEDSDNLTNETDSQPSGSDNNFDNDKFLNFLNLPNYTALDKDTRDEISEEDIEYNDDLEADDEFDSDHSLEVAPKNDIRESRDLETTDHPRPLSIFELMAMD